MNEEDKGSGSGPGQGVKGSRCVVQRQYREN